MGNLIIGEMQELLMQQAPWPHVRRSCCYVSISQPADAAARTRKLLQEPAHAAALQSNSQLPENSTNQTAIWGMLIDGWTDGCSDVQPSSAAWQQ
jgi:hypothetical protein